MSGLVAEISAEANRFLDGERTDVQRSIYRSTVIDLDGSAIDIEQMKLIQPEEMALVRAKGALALATTEWFNDIEWLEQPRKEFIGWRGLSLNATYPLDYFAEPPGGGLYVERKNEECWQDQYGAISGFGNGNGIDIYVPRFVDPDSRTITELEYPTDPTAMEQYNARYRQYMLTLNETDSKITYYRGWDYAFSNDREKAPLVLAGLSLAGLGVNEVLHSGAPAAEDEANCTRIVLHHEPKQGDYVGRDVIIVGDEATTAPYWDGEDDTEPASERLLETTLELLKQAS